MSRLALIAAVAGSLCLVLPATAQTPAERGLLVYGAQKCSMCHAVAGKGNAKGPLDGVGMKYTAEELREWIVNAKVMSEKHKTTRKPVMRDYSALPAADVDALVAYLQTLK